MAEEKRNFKPTRANTNWPTPITDGEEGAQEFSPQNSNTTLRRETNDGFASTGDVTTLNGNTTTPDGTSITGNGKTPIVGKIIPKINSYSEPVEEYETKWLLKLKPELIETFASLRNELKELLNNTSNDIRLLYAMARMGKEDTVALLNLIDNEDQAVLEHTLRYLWQKREAVAGGQYDFGLPKRARTAATKLEEEMAELYQGQVLPGRDGKKVLEAIEKMQEVVKGVIQAGEAEVRKVGQETRTAKVASNEKENTLNSMEKIYEDRIERYSIDRAASEQTIRLLKNDLNKAKQELVLERSKVNHFGKMIKEQRKDKTGTNDADYKRVKEELEELYSIIVGFCPGESITNIEDAKAILRERLPRVKQAKAVKSLQAQVKAAEEAKEKAINNADFKHFIWGVEKSKTNSMIKRALKTLGGGNVLIAGISEPSIREKFNQVCDNFQYKWFKINETRKELEEKNIKLVNDLGSAMNARYNSNDVNPMVFKPGPSPDQIAAQEIGANFAQYKEKKARNELFINPEFAYTARPEEFRGAFNVRGGRAGYGANVRGRGRGRGYGMNNTSNQPNNGRNDFRFNE